MKHLQSYSKAIVCDGADCYWFVCLPTSRWCLDCSDWMLKKLNDRKRVGQIVIVLITFFIFDVNLNYDEYTSVKASFPIAVIGRECFLSE